MRQRSPCEILVLILGGEMVTYGFLIVSGAKNPLSETIKQFTTGDDLGVLLWGLWMMTVGSVMLYAWFRQEREKRLTHLLFYSGIVCAFTSLMMSVTWLYHFGEVSPQQALHIPNALGSFYMASEGRSPFGGKTKEEL